ncbi:putative Apoptosis-inducing factor 2 [Seiridium cardinale]|uniref:Apoptosis-inducing factor 2 n=1 Tax=Seiridium cardinale TaxID=138064 RepID=A0ABR2Y281_9PEZI
MTRTGKPRELFNFPMMMSSLLFSLQNAVVVAFHFITANYFHPLPVPSSASGKMKRIVIVGGSFAGVETAHRILKQAAKTSIAPLKITLVSRDSHFYWNIAAPRGIVPGQLSDEQLFQPIAAGFSQYPSSQFEFVLGTATGVDSVSKQLRVSEAGGKEIVLDYDFLIIGTGASTKADTPFKSRGSTEATKQALHDYQARIKAAKTIAVAGAGPTGVETAGELAFEYGHTKKIILISSSSGLLDGPARPPSISKAAEKALQALDVDIRLNSKVKDERQLPDSRQEIIFSSGDKVVVDMYIPAFGVKPNSSFVPAEFLDPQGFIMVDEFLAVKGASGIFALGDVSDSEPPQILIVQGQSKHLARNMILTLSDKPVLPYKVFPRAMMGVNIGKNSGTGHVGSLRLPSFLVAMLRRTLFVEKLPKTVDGSIL